jgi:probable HAF family extracellular repeat protein
MVDLGTLRGGLTSTAVAVNNQGMVVGTSDRADGRIHAFSWTRAGGMVDLGTLVQNNASFAQAVNDRGQVAGGSYLDDPEVSHAILWIGRRPATANRRGRDLGTLPGGVYSVGLAVNNGGQVAGVASLTPDDPDFRVVHAFSWSAGGGLIDLGTLGGTESSAVDINSRGQVVGSSELPGDLEEHATLWNTR